MTSALVVGAGAVGARAARQLVDTPGLERLLVTDRDPARAGKVAEAMGERAEAVTLDKGWEAGPSVVVSALPGGDDLVVVHHGMARGVPCASVADDHDGLASLRRLDAVAARAGVTVAIGCGLAPGLADVLARHAVDAFDEVDEIKVARTGWSGPACVASVRHARRGPALRREGGGWRDDNDRDEELVWFPEPIGAQDCRGVAGGVSLLADAFPAVERCSVLLGEPPKRSWFGRRFGDDGEWGAARVEVYGRRGAARDCVVYGVVERTAVAAGTVLGVTAAMLAGILGPKLSRPGVSGLGVLVDPVPFLAELAQRGVRVAVFEGVPVS